MSQRLQQAAAIYNQRAISHALQGRLEQAVACLVRVVRLRPASAGAHNNLGILLSRLGRYEEARASYQQALRLQPHLPEAHYNLADTLTSLGRYKEAVRHCRLALALRPTDAKACTNLGNAYLRLGKLSTAQRCYRQALKSNPELAEARNGLGFVLAGLNNLEEAAAQYRAALRLKPDFAEAFLNLGLVLAKLGRWSDAVAAFQKAVALQPNPAKAQYLLGFVLGEQGRPKEAARRFEQTLRLQPDHVDAHWGLALSRLVQGDFEQGWLEYEWRWRLKGAALPRFPRPLWDGSSLVGRTILLHTEQGFGDTIQFVRYTAVVKRRGGTVILGCKKTLLPLLKSCPGIDRVVPAGSLLPDFDVHAPLLSLPRILKTSLSTVPAEIPYLFPDARLRHQWQRRLRRFAGFKIGIAWQGNPQHHKDRERSFPLRHFAPLARRADVFLISLQKGVGTEQLRTLAGQFRVIDLGPGPFQRSRSFMDTAAIMVNLDLVITPDTAIAHLAGALGVPVWVALPYVADWRWLLGREDSPWYPTMRLFRQSKPGDWDGVFARMTQELAKRIAACARPISLHTIASSEPIEATSFRAGN